MKHILTAIAATLASTSLSVHAEEIKHLQVGIGSYVTNVSYFNSSDDEFSGGAISAAYALNDNLSFRASVYALENDVFSALENKGYDLSIYGGTGLMTHGFKIYGGGGIFSETWQVAGFEDDFSGVQLGGGIGYNWDTVALDFIVGIRSISDYEDNLSPFGLEVESSTSGTLALSIRF